ncbi:type II toxin-antitoxin system CcdA family antitoxin [Rhodovulum adriaticum]|nr:type II toxin-antitoxin system CcdA family antitoxin [Rhodovulum adriaticum]
MCIIRVFHEDSMPQATSEKQRTNVTLTAATLAAARELGLNVSAISDAALAAAVRKAKADAWAEENAGAIAERRAWIEANGTPLAELQVLKID